MDYQPREITIFKEEEFILMLAAAGIEDWYGVDFEHAESEPESDRAFNASLVSLYMKNIVEWGDEKAHITDAYKPIFRTIRDAKVCIRIETAGVDRSAKGCYSDGTNVVTVERRQSSTDEIEVSIKLPVDWLDEVMESGLLPETVGVPDKESDLKTNMVLLSKFELRNNPGGELLRSMKVYEKGLYGFVELTTAGGEDSITENCYYSEGVVINELKSWIGGMR